MEPQQMTKYSCVCCCRMLWM